MGLESVSSLGIGRDLAVEATAASVLRALREAGVRAVLLKGPVLRRWLYDDEPVRGFGDVDLLVGPVQLAGAGATLQRLGFRRKVPVDGVNREACADTWVVAEDTVPVELHWTLEGVRATPEHLWEALSAETTTFNLGDLGVEVLGLPARAMHVALHSAQHGARSGRATRDLERALSRVEMGTWRAAATLAARVEATEAFAAGLRILPAGRDLAGRLDLPDHVSTGTLLHLAGEPRLALGIERLAAAEGARAKAALLGRKVLPEPEFMRAWSSLARRGPLGMAAAYIWRPIYLLAAAPGAAWNWARAHRRARRSRPRDGQ